MMDNMANRIAKVIRSPRRTGTVVTGLFMLVWAGGCGGAFTGIPDLDTADGRIFAQQCAACHGKRFGRHAVTHGVPDPRLRTMAEWREVLPKMDELRREARLPPLTDPDREAITRYLSRHAKS